MTISASRLAARLARESSRRIIWLAEDDGQAAGMVNLAVFERMPSPGRLSNPLGIPGQRLRRCSAPQSGVGSMLIAALLEYADDNAFARVVLSPSERSGPFYDRAGSGPASTLLLRAPRRGGRTMAR